MVLKSDDIEIEPKGGPLPGWLRPPIIFCMPFCWVSR